MALAGELVSLLVSLAQEIGIVAGVGALTITLVGHLLSLHAHKNETVFSYVRAARHIRAVALIVIIISGGAAILIHFQSGTPQVLLAPAFLFKWLLIAALTAFYFVELKMGGIARDAVEGFEGANWYALLIVHAMAPVAGWGLLLAIYFGWLATFGAIWAGFVWFMRGHKLPKLPKMHVAPKPVALKPAPAPVMPPAPMPAAQKTIPIEVHPNHSLLPMIAELDLPAPIPRVPAPLPKVPAPEAAPVIETPVPAPVLPAPVVKPQAPVEIAPEPPKPAIQMTNLDESGLPALHVMPKRPEDIESSKRGPVVKMGDE